MGTERRYNTVPQCWRCKKSSLKEPGITLCCDCGVSLCSECARQKCASKKSNHLTLNIKCWSEREYWGDLCPSCSKCKKGKTKHRVEATKHCYDCGKSYCDRCSKEHEQSKDYAWHELVCVYKMFAKKRTMVETSGRPTPSAPALEELEESLNLLATNLGWNNCDGDGTDISYPFEFQRSRSNSRAYYGEPTQYPCATRPMPIPGARTRTNSEGSCFSIASSTSSFCSTDEGPSPPPYTEEDRLGYLISLQNANPNTWTNRFY